jgi:DNA-directed RNA polymerase sigma subunit (sigma70/sigma32)
VARVSTRKGNGFVTGLADPGVRFERPSMLESTTTYLRGASLDELVTTASREPVLDEQGEATLAGRWRDGDPAALERLVMGNLRIAVDEAIRNRGLGFSQQRLVRRGVAVLMDAASDYDPDRDGPFSSFARLRVRSALSQDVSLV